MDSPSDHGAVKELLAKTERRGLLEFVIISYEVRLAVAVEKKVRNEDLLG